MGKKPRTAITPTREDDFPEWYQQVIKAADMAENSPVRGCMIIKPYGFATMGKYATHIRRLAKRLWRAECKLSSLNSSFFFRA